MKPNRIMFVTGQVFMDLIKICCCMLADNMLAGSCTNNILQHPPLIMCSLTVEISPVVGQY